MLIGAYQGISFNPSRIIEWITRGIYSHISLVCDEQTELAALRMTREGRSNELGKLTNFSAGSVIEAWLPKVRNTPHLAFGHTPGTPIDLYEFVNPATGDPDLPSLAEEEIGLTFLGGEIGTPYNVRDVLRFITKRPGNLDGSWFCSEIGDAYCERVNRNLFNNLPAWLVDPNRLVTSIRLSPKPIYRVITTAGGRILPRDANQQLPKWLIN